jgi:hypothetical protein
MTNQYRYSKDDLKREIARMAKDKGIVKGMMKNKGIDWELYFDSDGNISLHVMGIDKKGIYQFTNMAM